MLCTSLTPSVCNLVEETAIMQMPTWETCAILVEQRPGGHWFFANAVGPAGRYPAGVFPVFSGSYYDGKKAVAAHDKLLSTLTREGWEPTTRGEYWYSYRFRRQREWSNAESESEWSSPATEEARIQIRDKNQRATNKGVAGCLLSACATITVLSCIATMATKSNGLAIAFFLSAIGAVAFGIWYKVA